MGQRSTSRSTDAAGEPDGLVVGRVRAPHGVRGEVRVEPRTDVPDRFAPGAALDCDGVGRLVVKSVRGAASEPVVRFAGYERREDADRLRGRFLRVARDEARRAAGEGYLWADLVGLRVEAPDGAALGTIIDIIRAGETDVLVVRDIGGHDELLPAITSVIRSVDVAGGRVIAVRQEVLE